MTGNALDHLRSSLRAVLSVFSNGEIRRLQLSWAAMSFAMWAFAIALGVYAFDVGGAALVGIAALVRLLPGAAASPIAGALGDRHSRRSVLLWSAVASAIALGAATLAAAAGAPAAFIFVLAGAFTVAISPYVPAEGAMLPAVARTPQELSAANVAHSAMDNLGFLVGSMVTGILLTSTSPQVAFGAAAVATLAAIVLLAGLSVDRRPAGAPREKRRLSRETATGVRVLLADPRMRLVGFGLTLLVLFEGAADVLIVVLALEQLGLSDGSVGYLNAAWGGGALAGGAALAVLLHGGRLASGMLGGSLIAGAAMALAGIWIAPAAAYLAWIGIGIGYTAFEVAGRTLMQRVGSDHSMARALGSLETSRLIATAAGAVTAPGLIALIGVEGALIAFGSILPIFAVVNVVALRRLEIGSPIDPRRYSLLRENPIFAPLPVDVIERIAHDLVPVFAAPGEVVIEQGDSGDRFFLIAEGEVEVRADGRLRRREGPGESFGEIALLHRTRRTATVRARSETEMLALDGERFIAAVTGHIRSREVAEAVARQRLYGPPADDRAD